VTNGSAKAVAIDARVGSLEAGKDGDFVIWSGNPLSQFTRAEQTWVDGRRYFSLEEDAAMRVQIDRERTQLIQAILSVGENDDEDEDRGRRRRPGRN
jgi:cytosine/adenosine deaminase-related metal-dependent hydrolase